MWYFIAADYITVMIWLRQQLNRLVRSKITGLCSSWFLVQLGPMPGKRRFANTMMWVLISVGLLSAMIFQAASHADGLRVRFDLLMTFARGVVDPVQPVPTANLAQVDKKPPAVYTRTPTQTGPGGAAGSTALAPAANAAAASLPTATPAVPSATATPAATLTPPPPHARLEAPAYELQDLNNCGPATLSMYLRHYGWEGDQFTISNLIKPQRDDRNVNIEELNSYLVTNVGWLETQYRVGGNLITLRRLLASGFPVMIEEGFKMTESYWPNDDLWAGHYLLLTGYDDATQSFIGQDSYVSANRVISYANLDLHWKAFNRVYMLVYRPEQREQVQQILGVDWDRDQNRQNALDLARQEIDKDSTDSFAWFNLGSNLVYFERYSEAARAYDAARELGLPQRMLRYQFGPFFAYFHTGRNEDLMALTEYALKRTPNAEEAMLWRGWALYRQGNVQEAVQMFQNALIEHPNYTDAQYALKFIQGN
jgi:tetratricopeptide (TPR) repeat protein